MSKASVISISFPSQLSKEVDKLAKAEHRTKSGFIQEAVRYYMERRRWRKLQRKISKRARAMGIETDDDIEALVDSVRE
jgi:metal-responsive CopG/Arc/MetJ family transcriptional regulator